MLQALPLNGHLGTTFLYGTVLCSMGVLISWAAPACNNPIFSEIVPPHLRTVIYAFDRSFESAVAASAAPLVGLLAERAFGWEVRFFASHDQSMRNNICLLGCAINDPCVTLEADLYLDEDGWCVDWCFKMLVGYSVCFGKYQIVCK